MRILDINKYKYYYPYFEFDKFNEIEKEYYIYHIPRFELLVNIISDLINRTKSSSNSNSSNFQILDIGPHFLTEIIRNKTGLIVDQLGWRYDFITKPRENEKHIEFNLNDCIDITKWPQIVEYDLLVACEILEHVYTSFDYIFPFLNKTVKTGGYLLIGTPNAVSLKRRISMIMGKNPFDLITTTIFDPNHFREYTKSEMIDIAYKHGFELKNFRCCSNYNYVNHGLTGKTYKFISRFLPYSLRDNMTFLFRKYKNIL